MQTIEKRAEPRIKTNFPGTLTLDGASVDCVIQNMCSRGFLIKAGRTLPVGSSIRLTCELYPGQRVECTVQVRHINAGCLGAKVTEMSEAGLALCRKFLEEQSAAATGS